MKSIEYFDRYCINYNFDFDKMILFLSDIVKSYDKKENNKQVKELNEKQKNNFSNFITTEKIDLGFLNNSRDYIAHELAKHKIYFNVVDNADYFRMILLSDRGDNTKEIIKKVIVGAKDVYKRQINLEKFYISKKAFKEAKKNRALKRNK